MRDIIDKYTIEFIAGAILAWVTTTIIKLKKRNTATQDGVKALLKSEIIQIYHVYSEKGNMPIYARENAMSLYEEYKNLGGNGVVDDLMKKMLALPIERSK